MISKRSILQPEDLTIAVIARLWIHSTSSVDTELTATALHVLSGVVSRTTTKDDDELPAVSVSKDLLPRYSVGLRASFSTDEVDLAHKVLDTVSARLHNIDTSITTAELHLIALFDETDFIEIRKSLLTHEEFWKAVIALLPRVAATMRSAVEHTDTSAVRDVVNRVLNFMGVVLHNAQLENVENVRALITSFFKSSLNVYL
jgi:hypothetical protein